MGPPWNRLTGRVGKALDWIARQESQRKPNFPYI